MKSHKFLNVLNRINDEAFIAKEFEPAIIAIALGEEAMKSVKQWIKCIN